MASSLLNPALRVLGHDREATAGVRLNRREWPDVWRACHSDLDPCERPSPGAGEPCRTARACAGPFFPFVRGWWSWPETAGLRRLWPWRWGWHRGPGAFWRYRRGLAWQRGGAGFCRRRARHWLWR